MFVCACGCVHVYMVGVCMCTWWVCACVLGGCVWCVYMCTWWVCACVLGVCVHVYLVGVYGVCTCALGVCACVLCGCVHVYMVGVYTCACWRCMVGVNGGGVWWVDVCGGGVDVYSIMEVLIMACSHLLFCYLKPCFEKTYYCDVIATSVNISITNWSNNVI